MYRIGRNCVYDIPEASTKLTAEGELAADFVLSLG